MWSIVIASQVQMPQEFETPYGKLQCAETGGPVLPHYNRWRHSFVTDDGSFFGVGWASRRGVSDIPS
jgi:hypothetical protein